MSRFFYDTEFYEDGSRIHLISFGMVDDLGRELYMENSDFDWSIVPEDHWIRENVRPWLQGPEYFSWIPKHRMGAILEEFMMGTSPKEAHELWGWYSAYDHVVLAQLFGTMSDLPKGIPMFTGDLKQEAARVSLPGYMVPVQAGVAHHALSDARWTRDLYSAIRNYESENR